MAKLKLAVLISGRGSNLAALIEACRTADFPAEIVLVVSNRADAAGLQRAAEAGIATRTLSHRGWPDREAFDRAMAELIAQSGAGLICLAGFMRLLTPWFVARWQDRLVNIHPSLLPAFKGLDAQRQAIDAGVRIAGCSVHYVTGELDGGPIIAQAAVPVLSDDDEASLSSRILAAEHRLYPLVVRWIAEGRVTIERRHGQADRVRLAGIDRGQYALFPG